LSGNENGEDLHEEKNQLSALLEKDVRCATHIGVSARRVLDRRFYSVGSRRLDASGVIRGLIRLDVGSLNERVLCSRRISSSSTKGKMGKTHDSGRSSHREGNIFPRRSVDTGSCCENGSGETTVRLLSSSVRSRSFGSGIRD